MIDLQNLQTQIENLLGDKTQSIHIANDELTIEILPANLLTVAKILREHPAFSFVALIDLCGVDYLDYGISEWETVKATGRGFDRGVDRSRVLRENTFDKSRFAVVYHLLSYTLNQRLRMRIFVEGEPPIIDSVISIWPSANWYEREAFDLFGILFNGHPDLRRILTDYGFIGYPFRKDFPLSGTVEVRFDAALGRVVYEPIDLNPRILVPKVIRKDNRYALGEEPSHDRNP